MVYSILPKPLKDAKQPASLSNLSYELLLQILKDVPTPSVLKLREACKNAEPACNTVVSERRNTLYIHPSIGSLRKTLEIYNHPVFSQGVEEVVLLGNVDWRIIEEVHPGYRGGNNTEETNPIGRFSAWPLEFPRAKGLSEEDSNGLSGLSGFEFAYKPLIDALAKLPRLHKLSFAESGQKPGFNEVAQNTIDSHMHKYINSEHPARLKPMLRRTDANVLYNLLIIPKLKFTSLCLKTELPFTENVIGIYDYDRPQNLHEDFARAVSGLTHIELHVNLGWQNAGRHTLDNSLIECASDSLKSLKIVFVPDAAVRKASMGTVCNRILWQLPELHLPKLERFELALGEPPAGTSLATGTYLDLLFGLSCFATTVRRTPWLMRLNRAWKQASKANVSILQPYLFPKQTPWYVNPSSIRQCDIRPRRRRPRGLYDLHRR